MSHCHSGKHGSHQHAGHGAGHKSHSTSLLLGVACDTDCTSEDLAVAIDRFMTRGNHDFAALISLVCTRDSNLQPILAEVAGHMSVELETCSPKWQKAMDKYINKFHEGLEGLQWQAATVGLFTSGRKRLLAEPALFEINGHGIAIAICKVKDLPLAEYRSHILFCGIEPCIPESESKVFAHRLRKLASGLGLGAGERRLKITRSNCCGACRSGSVSVIYENLKPGETAVNNGSWIAHGDELSDQQWLDIFQAVDDRRPLTELLDARHFVTKQVR